MLGACPTPVPMPRSSRLRQAGSGTESMFPWILSVCHPAGEDLDDGPHGPPRLDLGRVGHYLAVGAPTGSPSPSGSTPDSGQHRSTGRPPTEDHLPVRVTGTSIIRASSPRSRPPADRRRPCSSAPTASRRPFRRTRSRLNDRGRVRLVPSRWKKSGPMTEPQLLARIRAFAGRRPGAPAD